MPEGNEVHRWAERHTAAFAGRKMHVEGPNGRFTNAVLLEGRKLGRVMPVGKHLGYDFGEDRILHVHLGRFGDWTEGLMPLPEVRGMLRLRMWRVGARAKKGAESAPQKIRRGWYSSGETTGIEDASVVEWAELRGPTDCSVYTQAKWEALLERLGPDPLNGDEPDRAIEAMRSSRMPVGQLLMEQDVLAGVGNIYRAELLFRAKLSPFHPGSEVSEKVLRAIWKDSVPLLKAGMVDRRIVTTEPEHRPHGKLDPPLKPEVHYVYRRQGKPCWVCGTTIQMKPMAGRKLFWCPTCQTG